MTQPANTGSLDQVLRFLQALAQSAAYSTELQAVVATMTSPFVPGRMTDVNGNPFWLTSDGTSTGTSLLVDQSDPQGWLGMVTATSTPAWAAVQITESLRPVAPYPRLILNGTGGPGVLGEEREYRVWHYGIRATAICSGTGDPEAAQREAIAMLEALESLTARNESLGGLVNLIRAEGPPQSGGYGKIEGSIVAGAQIRFGVTVERISGYVLPG